MSESLPANDPFLLEHWKQLRLEMNEVVARSVALERYALLSTGAIWAWLGTAVDADWHPALKWLPLLLNAFFALRAIGLMLRAREIASALAAAETYFSLPSELRLERRPFLRGIRMVSVWLFWPLLLAATLVLPFFYDEPEADSDYGQGRTMTLRSIHAPSGKRPHLLPTQLRLF
jgi:hypothetical protein